MTLIKWVYLSTTISLFELRIQVGSAFLLFEVIAQKEIQNTGQTILKIILWGLLSHIETGNISTYGLLKFNLSQSLMQIPNPLTNQLLVEEPIFSGGFESNLCLLDLLQHFLLNRIDYLLLIHLLILFNHSLYNGEQLLTRELKPFVYIMIDILQKTGKTLKKSHLTTSFQRKTKLNWAKVENWNASIKRSGTIKYIRRNTENRHLK